MKRVDLYAGVDTGPTHLMGAMQRPMVALYHSYSPSRVLAPLDHPCLYAIDHPLADRCTPEARHGRDQRGPRLGRRAASARRTACRMRFALFTTNLAGGGAEKALAKIASGTRVVSTDCPCDPREILRGELARGLVPCNDAKALAAAMGAALAAPKPAAKVVAAALAPYGAEHALDAWEALASA